MTTSTKMELTRKNIVEQLKKTINAKQKIISISLTPEDVREISQFSRSEFGGDYDIRTAETLFGYPLITGPEVRTSTINVGLHDDY